MTAKTGQKCTAIRRIIVPENKIDQVQKALITKLEKTIIGNPENKNVKMGALASKVQVERVQKNVELLMESQEKVFDNSQKLNLVDASLEKGAFFSPVLFRNDEPFFKRCSS